MSAHLKEILGKRLTRWVIFPLALVLVASAAFAAYRLLHQPPGYKGLPRLPMDLRHPDFLLVTKNLARLPKDIAATPALKGLVDAQLVFHYEEDEARLSMEGTIRRLAYEHNLDLNDRFIAALLAAPAEIGIWRGKKGRPEYFVATVERGALARFTQALTRIVSTDRQLKLASAIALGGKEVPIYTLAYGGGRTIAFAGVGDRWIFLSDPRLALDEKGGLSADVNEVLVKLLQDQHPWRDRLPPSAVAQHSIVVGAQALTMDYARFLPALSAFRFEHDGQQWHTALQLDNKRLPNPRDFRSIWRAVPSGAALCAALPVDWSAARQPLENLLGPQPALPEVLAALDPMAALCWYPDSRLSSPLFVARTARPLPPPTATLLAALAEKAWARDGASQREADKDGGQRFVSTIKSAHGSQRDNNKDKVFQATLAYHDNIVYFSPDERQVSAALNVAAKRVPALSDEPGLRAGAWLSIDPARLGQLLRADIQDVLPPDDEAFFRAIAKRKLWPRLDAWGKQQPASVLIPGKADADGFVALDFQSLKASK